jgi:hypothetical protein
MTSICATLSLFAGPLSSPPCCPHRYIVGNQIDKGRDPVTISVSADGITFDRHWSVRWGAPKVKYPGAAKVAGFQCEFYSSSSRVSTLCLRRSCLGCCLVGLLVVLSTESRPPLTQRSRSNDRRGHWHDVCELLGANPSSVVLLVNVDLPHPFLTANGFGVLLMLSPEHPLTTRSWCRALCISIGLQIGKEDIGVTRFPLSVLD